MKNEFFLYLSSIKLKQQQKKSEQKNWLKFQLVNWIEKWKIVNFINNIYILIILYEQSWNKLSL